MIAKNWFVLILVGCLTFLAACGGGQEDEPAGDNLPQNNEVNQEEDNDGDNDNQPGDEDEENEDDGDNQNGQDDDEEND